MRVGRGGEGDEVAVEEGHPRQRLVIGQSSDVHDVVAEFTRLSMDQKVYHTAAVIVSCAVVGFLLVYLRFIIVPLLLAFFLHYIFAPIVEFLTAGAAGRCQGQTPCQQCPQACPRAKPKSENRTMKDRLVELVGGCQDAIAHLRLPKWLAVLVALCVGMLGVVALWTVVFFSVSEFLGHADRYSRRMSDMSDEIYRWAMQLGLQDSASPERVLQVVLGLPIVPTLSLTVGSLVDSALCLLLVVIFLAYLLLGAPSKPTAGLRKEIDERIRRYIVLKVGLSSLQGIGVGLILFLLRVDLAFVFGLLASILNLIPAVGGIMAVLLPIPIIVLDPNKGWGTLALALVLLSSIVFMCVWFLEPSAYGTSMRLHEIPVLLGLVLFGAMWGILGAILAVPILVALRVCLERLHHPIAIYFVNWLGRFDTIPSPSQPETPAPTDDVV